ncbi:MAG: dihydroorotate dehydrogenase electron transfer subunit [Defluviitaleaceae bacterium]|nr:dihydroorotate dehydrogenase electron transfer subunit [Defluviitaleaceae bacterium]
MKHHVHAKIETHGHTNTHGSDIHIMRIHAPDIAKNARPGQFVMVYLDKGEHLLPRPISLHDVDKTKGLITLVYIVAGAGTKIMSQWPAGHIVRVLGPLGNGFDIDNCRAGDKVALVGGGLGAPPLYYLALELKKMGVNVDVYLGFRKDTPVLTGCFESLCVNLAIATEDGSAGHKGYVTDLLPHDPTYTTILSCGPAPMLKALSTYANAKNIPCQISVEERMACGIGACKGCVVKTLVGYRLCCTEGPVFDSKEVY